MLLTTQLTASKHHTFTMARKSKAKKNQTESTTAILATADILPTNAEDAPPPLDKEEEELERLVFGDVAGFRAGLKVLEYESEEGTEPFHAGVRGGDVAGKGQDISALLDDQVGSSFVGRRNGGLCGLLQLFFIDAGDEMALTHRDTDGDVEMVTGSDAQGVHEEDGESPAWEDSDDEKMMVSLASHTRMRKLRDTEADDFVTGKEYSWRLRRQFERIYPMPNWARPPKSDTKRRRLSDADGSESDPEMEIDTDFTTVLSTPPLSALLSSAADLTLSKPSRKAPKLRPEVIDIARLVDANVAAPSRSAIQCLSFHPTLPLLLTSGLDSTMRLYHIDGKINPLASSLHIRKSALQTALIHPSGTRILAAGRRRYFHSWDLQSGTVEQVTRVYGHEGNQRSMERFDVSPDGKYISFIGSKGTVQILDAVSSQWIATANVEGQVADISWHPNGETLSIANTAGEVYEYSLSTRSISAVWRDEGGVSTTCISNSPAGARFVAVGSASGVVNIYDRRVSFGGKGLGALGTATDPKPVKMVESLVTSISTLEFSRDGQVLCIASRNKKDALRLVHLPSCAIYKNWPTSATPLGKVTAVKWSGGTGGMAMAVGNEQGKVRLFEVRGS